MTYSSNHTDPPSPNRRFASPVMAVICLLAVAIGGGILLTSPPPEPLQSAVSEAAPIMVTATRLTVRNFADHIEAIGTAQAKESVTISAQVTEIVGSTTFSDGDFVKVGDVLVELIKQEEKAQLAEAKAHLAEANKQYERIASLVEGGNSPQSRLDQQIGIRDAAQARLDTVMARLSDHLIRAPFSGVLGMRMISPGTLLRPGDPIVTLDDISVIKLDFPVPEIHLAAVSSGQEITAISAAYPEQVFTGVVTAISSRVDPVTRAVTVRAEIDNPQQILKPGMLLSVSIISHPRRVLGAPENAVFQNRDRHFLFRIKPNNRVEKQQVMIGTRIPGWVEILGGVSAGDQVVTDGVHRLNDGSAVQIITPSPANRPNA